MGLEELINRLRIKLGAMIAEQKSIYSSKVKDLENNEDFNTFYNIFYKSSYTLDDINDLLVCNADHYLSNEEILDLVLKKNVILYDEDQFGLLFGLRNVILYYLLGLKDQEIVINTLKCFEFDDLSIKRDEAVESLAGLEFGNTLYDLYLMINEINSISNEDDRKKKVIGLMGILPYDFISPLVRNINITYEDIDKFLATADDGYVFYLRNALRNILNTKIRLDHKTIGNQELYSKVKKEYDIYASNHLNFLDSDFIDYYNNKYNDNFNCFYYNVSEFCPLNYNLLYNFNSFGNFSYVMNNNLFYGEFGEKYGFSYSIRNIDDYVARNKKRFDDINRILLKYKDVFENMKKEFSYTLNYYIFKNVDSKDAYLFEFIIDWYCVNQPDFFGRDIRNNSLTQKENTFNQILMNSREAMKNNFANRKRVHSKFYDDVVKYLGANYISKSGWNKLVADFEIDYYAEKGIHNIKILIDCLEHGINVFEKAESLHITDEIYHYFDAIDIKFPEFGSKLFALKNIYIEEENKILKERVRIAKNDYIEQCSELISKFLLSSYKSREAFLEEENLTESQFDKILETVEEFNFPLYVQFMNKFSSLKSQRYLLLMKAVDYVLDALVNGVEENGVVRPFNFMDYSLMTKLPFEKFAVLVVNSKKLNNTNIRQFRQFEKAVKSYKMVSNEMLFAEKNILRVNDALHEVTREEKELALRYLRANGLSNYYALYKIALNKVLNGLITVEQVEMLENGKKSKNKSF